MTVGATTPIPRITAISAAATGRPKFSVQFAPWRVGYEKSRVGGVAVELAEAPIFGDERPFRRPSHVNGKTDRQHIWQIVELCDEKECGERHHDCDRRNRCVRETRLPDPPKTLRLGHARAAAAGVTTGIRPNTSAKWTTMRSSTSTRSTGRPSTRASEVTPRSAIPHGTIRSK